MRRIYLIAGHNGYGTGASGFMDEGTATIQLRDEIAYYLKEAGVPYSTDTNTLKLTGVVAWLKRLVKKSDIVLDIHFNASTNPLATGVECLISKEGAIEADLANELCATVVEVLKIRNRGVKAENAGAHSKLAMLSNFQAEQVILEVCFVSNENDCKEYNAKHWLVAKSIAQILIKYAKV